MCQKVRNVWVGQALRNSSVHLFSSSSITAVPYLWRSAEGINPAAAAHFHHHQESGSHYCGSAAVAPACCRVRRLDFKMLPLLYKASDSSGSPLTFRSFLSRPNLSGPVAQADSQFQMSELKMKRQLWVFMHRVSGTNSLKRKFILVLGCCNPQFFT